MAPRRSLRVRANASEMTTSSGLQLSNSEPSLEQSINPIVLPSHKSSFEIPYSSDKLIKCERYDPRGAQDAETRGKETSSSGAVAAPTLIFTHGAGGGLSNPATTTFAIGASVTASTLVFAGGPNLTARTKQFQAVLRHVLDSQTPEGAGNGVPALGGRSLGARAAVQTANACNADDTSSTSSPLEALVLVSYPLTGPKGDMRDAILCSIQSNVDVLFLSGDRDVMCDLEQLNEVRKRMSAHTWLAVVQGADHGMSLKPASEIEARRKATGALAARWLSARDRKRTECVMTGTDIEQWTASAEQGTRKGDSSKRKVDDKADRAKTTKKPR